MSRTQLLRLPFVNCSGHHRTGGSTRRRQLVPSVATRDNAYILEFGYLSERKIAHIIAHTSDSIFVRAALALGHSFGISLSSNMPCPLSRRSPLLIAQICKPEAHLVLRGVPYLADLCSAVHRLVASQVSFNEATVWASLPP